MVMLYFLVSFYYRCVGLGLFGDFGVCLILNIEEIIVYGCLMDL